MSYSARFWHDLAKEQFATLNKVRGDFKNVDKQRAVALFVKENLRRAKARIGDEPLPDYWQQKRGLPYLTQKATGLRYLVTTLYNMHALSYDNLFILPYDIERFAKRIEHQALTKGVDKIVWFGRPAPTRPRHGFVDSKTLNGWAELVEMFNKALAEDPDAELIVMPKLSARYSAVVTNAGISFGKGAAGVTNGKKAYTIPIAASAKDMIDDLRNGGMQAEHLGLNTAPYIEMVQNIQSFGNSIDETLDAVQLRDGPVQQASTTIFVPRKMKVDKFINYSHTMPEDLLEWERTIKDYAAQYKGKNVAIKINGGLSSHYAVHAIEHGFAVITNEHKAIVKEGTVLEPDTNFIPMEKFDYREVSDGIAKWSESNYLADSDYTQLVDANKTAVAIIHSNSQWGSRTGDVEYNSMRAFAAMTLFRTIAATVIGELRHWWSEGPGRWGVEMKTEEDLRENIRYSRRNEVYQRIYNAKEYPLRRLVRMMNNAAKDYDDSRRDSGWSGNYGGHAWYNVAKANHELGLAIIGMKRFSTEKRWRRLISAANVALHTVHNNGMALTKIVSGRDLDRIARFPALYGMNNPTAASLVLEDTWKPLKAKDEAREWAQSRSTGHYLYWTSPEYITQPTLDDKQINANRKAFDFVLEEARTASVAAEMREYQHDVEKQRAIDARVNGEDGSQDTVEKRKFKVTGLGEVVAASPSIFSTPTN